MNDLAKVMTNAEREQSHPNVRPKDAATLILVDRSGATPTVLLGKRHHKHVFMPGKFVFPGGRAEPNDRLMPIAKPLNKKVEKQLMRNVVRPSTVKARPRTSEGPRRCSTRRASRASRTTTAS